MFFCFLVNLEVEVAVIKILAGIQESEFWVILFRK